MPVVTTGTGASVRLRALVVGLLLTLFAGACSSSPADPPEEAGPYHPPRGPTFGEPVPRDSVEDNRILQVLLANIEHTPPGATIRIVARSLSLQPAATALIAAHERGVKVQVIASRKVSGDFKAVGRLREALGTDHDDDSFIRLVRGSARGGDTEQHQKTWSFSRTGEARHVVMVGSTNLSYSSMGQYNDMYTFVGRRDIWRQFAEVFRVQLRDEPVADPAISVDLGRDHAWFYPGYDVETDPVRRYLADLPADGLRVRIAMLAWHGERGNRIAAMLADKARAGAEVEVVVSTLGDRTSRILTDAGVRVASGRLDAGWVHHKLTLVSWVDESGKRQRRILTGSDNFGAPSLARDEVVVAVHARGGRGWRSYHHHFDRLLEQAP